MNHIFFSHKSHSRGLQNLKLTHTQPYQTQPHQTHQYFNPQSRQRMIGSHIVTPRIIEISSPQLDAVETYFKHSTFKLHIGLYDTWPTINNAEKEILFRILHACNLISVGVFVITNDGTITGFSNISDNNFVRLKNSNLNHVPKKYISFVLSLHYDSPKTTHHRTLHALWNPLNYMNEPHHVQNFKSFDGYLSCYSNPIDNFKNSITNAPIIGHLNHTLSHPMHDVSTEFNDDLTCFYAGINWEKVNTSYKSLRQNVLQLLKNLELDKLVSIYGPTQLLNVNVWEGFASYKGEIPFDGISMIHVIKKCGICLVLSSVSHIKYEIVSTRLFEGLAAGVPLICDNNSFINKWFGNNVFYIDLNDPNCDAQVKKHIEFIKNNNDIVIEKLKQCREIFLTNFLMHEQIKTILNRVNAQ